MKFPPQHGAWSFLILPAVMAAFLGAGNIFGFIFFITWICGYPTSYFIGRALITRIRRGSWTPKAKKDLIASQWWLVVTSVGSIFLLLNRPWLLLEALGVLVIWSMSIYLSWLGRERGITNDLLLVTLASLAPLLMYQVARDHSSLHGIPHAIWSATFMSLVYFIGSVLHVKALIRESKNRRWHISSIIFHSVLLLVFLVAIQPKFLAIPFVFALVRTVRMEPGLRPGTIGVVELILGVGLIVATVASQS